MLAERLVILHTHPEPWLKLCLTCKECVSDGGGRSSSSGGSNSISSSGSSSGNAGTSGGSCPQPRSSYSLGDRLDSSRTVRVKRMLAIVLLQCFFFLLSSSSSSSSSAFISFLPLTNIANCASAWPTHSRHRHLAPLPHTYCLSLFLTLYILLSRLQPA